MVCCYEGDGDELAPAGYGCVENDDEGCTALVIVGTEGMVDVGVERVLEVV